MNNHRKVGKVVWTSILRARMRHPGDRQWTDLGILSEMIVTAAAIADLITVMQAGSASNLQNYKFHASGTGTNPESGANTTLQTEVETRDSGTQTNPSPGVYRTVATHTYAAPHSITEHGVLSALTLGLLLDRSVFAAIPVVIGSQVQWSYDLTVSGT